MDPIFPFAVPKELESLVLDGHHFRPGHCPKCEGTRLQRHADEVSWSIGACDECDLGSGGWENVEIEPKG